MSSMVSTLASGYDLIDRVRGSHHRELGELAEQAFELACPIPDYEEAALQEGWTGPHKDKYGATFFKNATESEQNQTWCAKDWESLCGDFEIEPYDRDVFEHWAVSSWLAEKLIEQGEKVDTDFAGLNVWARTTTGQGISCDGVIERIYANMMKA